MEQLQSKVLFETLSAAIVFGFSAGFSPGPLLALTISQSVRHGSREGMKIAFAPFFTDVPIIAVSLAALAWLEHLKPVLGAITIAGSLFVCWLGYDSIRTSKLRTDSNGEAAGSLGKGIIANVLSPHPYIYWMTVGSPFVLRAWGSSHAAAVLFPLCFLSSLAAAKVLVAIAAGRSRKFLSDRLYSVIMKLLGMLLFIFAILLAREGAALLAVW
jgi:threonine/homoserine/homoserine lactone efflux protein